MAWHNVKEASRENKWSTGGQFKRLWINVWTHKVWLKVQSEFISIANHAMAQYVGYKSHTMIQYMMLLLPPSIQYSICSCSDVTWGQYVPLLSAPLSQTQWRVDHCPHQNQKKHCRRPTLGIQALHKTPASLSWEKGSVSNISTPFIVGILCTLWGSRTGGVVLYTH